LLAGQPSCCNRYPPTPTPQIYGLYIVKLATALMIVGGIPRCDEAGTHIRGELHMLLIGDPGTGAFLPGGVARLEGVVVCTACTECGLHVKKVTTESS
jgi:hypothetical protein